LRYVTVPGRNGCKTLKSWNLQSALKKKLAAVLSKKLLLELPDDQS